MTENSGKNWGDYQDNLESEDWSLGDNPRDLFDKLLPDNRTNHEQVLRTMCEGYAPGEPPRLFQINELASATGLKDEREVQRSLYILEGHKLVSPNPPGDFTSKVWTVTPEGLKSMQAARREALLL